MTNTFRVNDADIKRACSYITEDKAIADYFHVDVARVAAIRKRTSNKDAMRAERAQKREPMPSTAEENRMRADAKQGSNALLLALLTYFENRKNWIHAK
jgi:hypothetical protein